jgi:hypothetical protein
MLGNLMHWQDASRALKLPSTGVSTCCMLATSFRRRLPKNAVGRQHWYADGFAGSLLQAMLDSDVFECVLLRQKSKTAEARDKRKEQAGRRVSHCVDASIGTACTHTHVSSSPQQSLGCLGCLLRMRANKQQTGALKCAALLRACRYFVGAAWAAGMEISSGMFVPMLLIGAVLGRLMGLIMVDQFGVVDGAAWWLPAADSEWKWIDPGVFAVVGAAGFMGGVTRLTIALAAIMMEARRP